jgi:hypothetical protein
MRSLESTVLFSWTVCGQDGRSEPPWMGSRRVQEKGAVLSRRFKENSPITPVTAHHMWRLIPLNE